MALNLSKLLLLVLVLGSMAQAAEPVYQVFVGTYTDKQSKGIYTFRFDAASGKVTAAELAAETENPSFLAVDSQRKHLYAVNEVSKRGKGDEGGITTFDISGAQLKKAQEITSMGADPAYITIDNSGKYVLVANYTGGNIAAFPIKPDGTLGEHSAFVQHKGSSIDKERQTAPHAHSIQMTRDNRFALSADLGLDKVLVYKFDAKAGTLTPSNPAAIDVTPGAGPRHVVQSPNGKFIYVTNEMASTVSVFSFDPKTAAWSAKQTISTLPKAMPENSTAEIAIDAKGRFLYVSNRGEDSIAEFAVDQKTGSLSTVQSVPTGGKTPRFFTLDPTGKWMFVANQDTNDIFLFKVDALTGKLSPTGTKIEVGAPVALVFVKAS